MLRVWPTADFFHGTADTFCRRVASFAVAGTAKHLVKLRVLGFSAEYILDYQKINPEGVSCDLHAAGLP